MKIKFLVSTLLIALLSFACGLYLPWWTIAPVAFIVTLLIPQKPIAAFLAGFLALFLLWGGLALAIDVANGSLLSAKVAAILPWAVRLMPSSSSPVLSVHLCWRRQLPDCRISAKDAVTSFPNASHPYLIFSDPFAIH